MIKVDLEKGDFPFPKNEIIELLTEIKNETDLTGLNLSNSMGVEKLYDRKETKDIEGFSIKVRFQLNEQGDIETYINEFVLIENEDEWFEAYNRIGNSEELP